MAREAARKTQAAFARDVAVSRSAVEQWERGKTEPSAANLRRAAIALKVNAEWLATGSGDMTPRPLTYEADELGDRPVLYLRLVMDTHDGSIDSFSEIAEKLLRIKTELSKFGVVTGDVRWAKMRVKI